MLQPNIFLCVLSLQRYKLFWLLVMNLAFSIWILTLYVLQNPDPYPPTGTSLVYLDHLELCLCSTEWWNLLTCILDDAPKLRVLKLKLVYGSSLDFSAAFFVSCFHFLQGLLTLTECIFSLFCSIENIVSSTTSRWNHGSNQIMFPYVYHHILRYLSGGNTMVKSKREKLQSTF